MTLSDMRVPTKATISRTPVGLVTLISDSPPRESIEVRVIAVWD